MNLNEQTPCSPCPSLSSPCPHLILWHPHVWPVLPWLGNTGLPHHFPLLSKLHGSLCMQSPGAFSQGPSPRWMKQWRKPIHILNEIAIKKKHLISEWFQTPKPVLILKGYWIPNAVNSCGSIFPSRTWMEGTVGNQLRYVFGVWQLPDPLLLSLDQQGLCVEWQMRAKQQWLGYAATCVIWLCLQSAQLQAVSS